MCSISCIFPSNPMGQNTTFAIACMSSIFASMSRSATSHPPQPAPQYCAILIFSAILGHLFLLRGGLILWRLASHSYLLDQSPLLESDDVLHDLRFRDASGVVELVHRPRTLFHLLD